MLTGNEHRVVSLIYDGKADLVAYTRALVRFKTVTPADDGRAEGDGYQALQAWVGDTLESLGFELERWEANAAWALCPDAIHLINYAGIPTISIGPSGKTAHMADEHVEIDELVRTAQALALVIMRWCGVSEDSTRER